MSEPINIDGIDSFKKKVLEAGTPILVDFWAPWCGPCQMMAPILSDLAKEFKGKLLIAKVNTEVDENQGLAYAFQIQSIPNMKLFKDGKVIKDFIGFRPKELFEKELNEYVS